MTKLQLALDFMNLSRAKKVAEKSIEGGVDWLEIGTPLIKSEGKKAIEDISEIFENHPIVADMKTMDTGSLEVEIASKSGADIVSILGEASDQTINEACRSAKKHNSKIMVDLIGVENYRERTRDLKEFNIDYLLVHTGIDEQMAGASPLDKLKEINEIIDIPIAVAGGLDKKTVPKAIKSGADVVVVGGSIIRSKDPEKASRVIKNSMKDVKIESSGGVSREKQRENMLKNISTANLSDALHRRGIIKGIRKVSGKKEKVFGKARTVKTISGDWAKPVEALEKTEPGDILVINAGGDKLAVWGELATNSAINKGVKATIIDGGVRDISDIRNRGFPVWAKYITPEAGEPKGYGEIGSEIECGGVKINNGDYVLADEDGVVVIDKKEVDEMLNRAQMVYENEERVREEIKNNSTLSEVLELNKWEEKN